MVDGFTGIGIAPCGDLISGIYLGGKMSLLLQPLDLQVAFQAQHIQEGMVRLHDRVLAQGALAIDVCIAETFLAHRYLQSLIALPNHFGPMEPVAVDRSSVIEKKTLYLGCVNHKLSIISLQIRSWVRIM